MPIVAVFGGDEAAIRARVRELKELADGGSGMLETNLTTFDGRDARPPDVISAVMAVPFLAPARLVIIERLLERFQPHGFGTRDVRSLVSVQPLLDALQNGVPPTTTLLFTGFPVRDDQSTFPVTPANPLVKAIADLPGASIEHLPAPNPKSLPAYIEREAKARGLQFTAGRKDVAPGEDVPRDAGPVALLAALTQGNTLAIANELDKLRLYTGGGSVSIADVNRVCAGDRVTGQFELADAVLDGDLGRATELLHLTLGWGVDVGEVLFDLAGTYRRLLPVVEMVAEGEPVEAIGQAMGNAGRYPNLRDRAIRRARTLGIVGIRRAFEALADADRDSKTGLVGREIALELTISQLCALSRR